MERQPAVSPPRRVEHFQKNLGGVVAALRWYPELDLSSRTDRLLFSSNLPVTNLLVTFPHPHPAIPSRQQNSSFPIGGASSMRVESVITGILR
jgi:hypothetical protein